MACSVLLGFSGVKLSRHKGLSMPLLGTLLAGLFGKVTALFIGMFGAKYGLRILAATALATGYVSCVVYWSGMIAPWMASIFATSYGSLLGLLFPPISGSVLAGLVGFWTAVIVQKYTSTLLKMVAN